MERDVALSSPLVAMYSTVASNCLYDAWPDHILYHDPELKACVHYDSERVWFGISRVRLGLIEF